MTPERVNPDGVPALVRELAEAWMRRAADPVSWLADDPQYLGACVDVSLALERCAVDLGERLARRRGD